MPTQHGLPVEEEKRLKSIAPSVSTKTNSSTNFIEDHKGDIVVIDGYTLRICGWG